MKTEKCFSMTVFLATHHTQQKGFLWMKVLNFYEAWLVHSPYLNIIELFGWELKKQVPNGNHAISKSFGNSVKNNGKIFPMRKPGLYSIQCHIELMQLFEPTASTLITNHIFSVIIKITFCKKKS